jgi:hypothetical protein
MHEGILREGICDVSILNLKFLHHYSDFYSSTPERALMNYIKPSESQTQAIFVDKYLDQQSPEQEVNSFPLVWP